MTKRACGGLVTALCIGLVACSSQNTSNGGTGGTGFGFGGTGVLAGGSGGTGVPIGTAGSSAQTGAGGQVIFMPPTGVGGASGAGGGAGLGAAGHAGVGGAAGGAAGAAGHSGAGGASGGGMGGASGAGGSTGAGSLTGTLGALGAAKPVVNGWATTNGLETFIYLSSAPLTCAMMMTQGTKWLSTLPAGTQVIEIVLMANATAQMYTIGGVAALGGAEVNYAEGSKSSATEVTGSAGSVTLTTAMPMGAFDGMLTVTAPYTLSGSFHAQWCQGGTEY
jgi:hypothetical protein